MNSINPSPTLATPLPLEPAIPVPKEFYTITGEPIETHKIPRIELFKIDENNSISNIASNFFKYIANCIFIILNIPSYIAGIEHKEIEHKIAVQMPPTPLPPEPPKVNTIDKPNVNPQLIVDKDEKGCIGSAKELKSKILNSYPAETASINAQTLAKGLLYAGVGKIVFNITTDLVMAFSTGSTPNSDPFRKLVSFDTAVGTAIAFYTNAANTPNTANGIYTLSKEGAKMGARFSLLNLGKLAIYNGFEKLENTISPFNTKVVPIASNCLYYLNLALFGYGVYKLTEKQTTPGKTNPAPQIRKTTPKENLLSPQNL